MVFSSIPAYLDPSNWQQQVINQIGSSSRPSSQLLHPEGPEPPPHPPLQNTHGGAASGSVRPGSMSERARFANIPLPEAALKCPRCESTNTKFCYFNNYSLTQPRHFCKTCRRYWTRGGALRSVPVGGGCRRNKKRKGNSSKSPISSDQQTGGSGSSSMIPSSSGHTDILNLGPNMPPLRFMAPLHNLNEFASGEVGLNYGLNYSTDSAPMSDLNFQPGVALGSGGAAGSLLGLDQQWRIQQTPQFPFLSCFDPSTSLFERPSGLGITQFPSVKMEESQQDQGLNLGRQFLGSVAGNEQYWSGTNPWSDLSGFNSSSTTSNPP